MWGAPEQKLGIAAIILGVQGDADAGSGDDLLALDRERLVEGIDHPLGKKGKNGAVVGHVVARQTTCVGSLRASVDIGTKTQDAFKQLAVTFGSRLAKQWESFLFSRPPMP